MMEKALMVVMFMYVVSLSLLGVQYVIGDTLGMTITNYNGVAVESHLLSFVDEATFNTQTQNVVDANFTGNSTYYDKVETFSTSAAYIAWELVLLLTGTYIFNFLLLMGVPSYFVGILVTMYIFLLARAIIGLIRGI